MSVSTSSARRREWLERSFQPEVRKRETDVYTRLLAPSFAGIATFMRAPGARLDAVSDGDIAIAGVPWDDGENAHASAVGWPRAVREVSAAFATDVLASPGRDLVDVETGRRVRFPERLAFVDLG